MSKMQQKWIDFSKIENDIFSLSINDICTFQSKCDSENAMMCLFCEFAEKNINIPKRIRKHKLVNKLTKL